MADESRRLLLEPGSFVDAHIEESWKTVYISNYRPAESQVTVLIPTANSEDLTYMDLAVADCCPVFLYSKSMQNAYLRQILKLVTSEQLGDMMVEVKKLVVAGSEEHFVQLYRCLMPIYALISVGAEAASELKRLEIALSLASGFLEKVSETLTSPIQSNFSVLIINTWEDFKLCISSIIQNFTVSQFAHQSILLVEKSHYFEQICSLLNHEKCPLDIVHDLAGLSFIWLTHRRDLRVELLAGYKLHIRSTKLADFAGFSQSPHIAKRANFLFLKSLGKIFTHDDESFIAFYQELILNCLQSSNSDLELAALRLLRQAVAEDKAYGTATFHLPGVRSCIARSSLSAAASSEVTEMFTKLIGKGDLKTFLQECGTDTSYFNQPGLVFPMIEKKDWDALGVMVSNGLRLSAFAANPEAVSLIVYCAIGRTIPVHLFQTLADIEIHPLIEVYYLLVRRYSKADQMSLLMSMARSHKQAKDLAFSLPRGQEEVGDMLLRFEFFHPRLQGLWTLERLGVVRRLPRGLLRCVVLEFAYPVKWVS